MDPVTARKTLAGLRTGLGVASLLAPRVTGGVFGIDAEANPAAPYLARLFGARELFMAAPVLLDLDGIDQRLLAEYGMAVDAADTVAALLAGVSGSLSWRASIPAATIAGIAVWLGIEATSGS